MTGGGGFWSQEPRNRIVIFVIWYHESCFLHLTSYLIVVVVAKSQQLKARATLHFSFTKQNKRITVLKKTTAQKLLG